MHAYVGAYACVPVCIVFMKKKKRERPFKSLKKKKKTKLKNIPD